MKTKEFVALEKSLLPHLPGFTIKGPLMFMYPLEHVLRGICFEGSSFDKKSFYVNMFILPLCIPTKYLYFLFGDRLRIRNADRWNIDDHNMLVELSAALKREALPFLSRVESIRDLVEIAKSRFSPENPHVRQAIAYGLARAGDVAEAVAAIDQLASVLDVNVSWQREMLERAEMLKAKLQENPEDAQRQLEAWEAETAKNLGLEKFR